MASAAPLWPNDADVDAADITGSGAFAGVAAVPLVVLVETVVWQALSTTRLMISFFNVRSLFVGGSRVRRNRGDALELVT